MSCKQTATKLSTRDVRLTNVFLLAIRHLLPVVGRTLQLYGSMPLRAYLDHVVVRTPSSYQPRDEVADAVYRYAAPLLGQAAAEKVRSELRDCPVILTANHHGVDFFAQSVQSTLLFGSRSLGGGVAATTVPVLACGSVPLNNVTYPRGALLYRSGAGGSYEFPKRLPILPDRLKRRMVTQVPAFKEAMVQKAHAKIAQMSQDNEITEKTAKSLRRIFASDYRALEVIGHNEYSNQAVILNSRIWRRLFAEASQAPELAYLEMEKVTSNLLAADLRDSCSLAFAMIFDPQLRAHLLQELDGIRGCWNHHELVRRWANRHQKRQHSPAQSCGTFLFWGINEAGHRIALVPAKRDRQPLLCGVDDGGKTWEIALLPQEIIQGLREKRLLPSLFISFLVISLARGTTCVGGYYQADYLPLMQQGTVAVLSEHSGFEQAAQFVAKVPTACYLSGMQAVMCQHEDGGLVPAGPIEIIRSGGLTAVDLQRLLSLTVREAHIASLFETITDVAPEVAELPDWRRILAKESRELLWNKVVVK
jgi:hypothetical protein